MLYAEVQDVEAGFRALSRDEQTQCAALLSEAAVMHLMHRGSPRY